MNITAPPPPIRIKRFKKVVLWIGMAFILIMLGLILFMVIRANTKGSSRNFIGGTRVIEMGLSTAIDTYEIDAGKYPASLDALWLKGSETNWNGPYVRSTNMFFDTWTNQFRYRVTDEGYDLRSAGADGVFFTKDDIKNLSSTP